MRLRFLDPEEGKLLKCCKQNRSSGTSSQSREHDEVFQISLKSLVFHFDNLKVILHSKIDERNNKYSNTCNIARYICRWVRSVRCYCFRSYLWCLALWLLKRVRQGLHTFIYVSSSLFHKRISGLNPKLLKTIVVTWTTHNPHNRFTLPGY